MDSPMSQSIRRGVWARAGAVALLLGCAPFLSAFQIRQAATPEVKAPGSIEGRVVNVV